MINDISIWVDDGDLLIYTAEDAISTKKSWVRSVDPVISAGKWYHIAGTRESGTLKLYLNGKEIGGDNSNQNIARNITNANPLILGKNTGGYHLDGKLDEFRVWSDVRSVTEIRENMMRTLNGTESNLVAYYSFDEVDGTKLYDISGTHHGTLTNMAGDEWVDSEAFNTWLGVEFTAWGTAGNWSDGLPDASENVGIYKRNLGYESTIGTASLDNLCITQSSSPTLSSNFSIDGNLILGSDLNLNGQTIDLGGTGYLIEEPGRIFGTTGKITTTRNLSNLSSENVAGLGAE